MKRYRKQGIIVMLICILVCIGIAAYLYIHQITSYGDRAMASDKGMIHSIDWYGAAFMAIVLTGMLVAMIAAKD